MLISNSRVLAFNECEQKHAYLYDYRIEPKEMDDTPWRGVIGHLGLGAYYANNRDRKAAHSLLATLALEEATALRYDRAKIISEISVLLDRYFDFVEPVDTFKVVGVELELSVPIGFGDHEFFGILDLIIETQAGKLWVMDHKFVFNFYSKDYLKVNVQMDKYIKAARDSGYPVEGAIINMLRVRGMKEGNEFFRRLPHEPSDIRIDNIWMNQWTTILRMEMLTQPNMALTNAVCKYCNYKNLCDMKLNGEDITDAIATGFKPRKSPADKPASEEMTDHGF